MADPQVQDAPSTATDDTPDPFDYTEAPEESMTVEDFAAEAEAKGGEDEKPQPESDGFEPGLINRAIDAGLTEEQARGLGTPEALLTVLDAFDVRLAAQGREAGKTDTAEGDAEPKEAPRERFQVTLDKEEYGEAVVSELERLNDYYHEQIGDLTDALTMVLDHIEGQIGDREAADFDTFVGTLGPEFEELLGKGATSQLIKTSPAYVNRQKVRDEAAALKAGYEQIKRPAPSGPELFQRALRGVFGDKIKSLARKEIAQQLDTRSAQHISRPSAAAGPGPTNRQTAIRNAAARMSAMGFSEPQNEPELLP